mmetsp:Transcript_2896/g.4121  ORF Transcript_2896/g.4121 Transcript_2896/m.4121 type:complete len:93 (-) Transcript_2896:26-304(-)
MRSEKVEDRGRRWWWLWFNDDETDLNCVSGLVGEINALDGAAARDEMSKANKCCVTILLVHCPPLICCRIAKHFVFYCRKMDTTDTIFRYGA